MAPNWVLCTSDTLGMSLCYIIITLHFNDSCDEFVVGAMLVYLRLESIFVTHTAAPRIT